MADQAVPGHLETWWHRARAGEPHGDPIPEEATELMLGWDHNGGFSLNAEV